jgi:hypothetical protein
VIPGDFTEDFGGGLGSDVRLGLTVVFVEIVHEGLFLAYPVYTHIHQC